MKIDSIKTYMANPGSEGKGRGVSHFNAPTFQVCMIRCA